MRFSKMLIASVVSLVALNSQFAAAWDNTPPIPERHPGWGEGKNQQMIEFEIYYDLTCSASAALHPEWKTFLDMPFLGRTVRDAIKVNYVFFPLPYHHSSWIPHKILPYVIDKCVASPLNCKLPYYIDFAFNNQNFILTSKDTSFNDLVVAWTGMVSTTFGWPQPELISLYSWDTDTHNSEMRTRYMWKYSASQGIALTPSMSVNGIELQEPPFDHNSMMQLLQDVYNSQRAKFPAVYAEIDRKYGTFLTQ